MVHGMRVISIQHLVYALSTATNCCSISAHGLVILRVWGRHMYAGGSTGVATLRRDGFAALRQTLPDVCRRLLCVSTEKDFGVNAQCTVIEAEIQDKMVMHFRDCLFQNCICRSVNSTKSSKSYGILRSLTSCYIRKARAYCFWLEQGKLFLLIQMINPGFDIPAGSVQHSV